MLWKKIKNIPIARKINGNSGLNLSTIIYGIIPLKSKKAEIVKLVHKNANFELERIKEKQNKLNNVILYFIIV